MLQKAYGDGTSKKWQVRDWHQRFGEDLVTVVSGPCSGGAPQPPQLKKTSCVFSMLVATAETTIKEVGISVGRCQKILNSVLTRKCADHWKLSRRDCL